jgi:SAM-dependent methyltransferase
MPPNTPTNRYGSIAAEIYDIDKPPGALPDAAFHLARLEGFTGRLLEPACGSGRTLLPLLQAGIDAIGFDPSPEMLSRCAERCAAHGFSRDLTLQRFQDFTYERPFEAILAPMGSFTLIDDHAEAIAVLRRFHDHLAPGGLLVLDIQPISFLAARGADRRQWTSPDGDYLTLEGVRVETDWLAQRTSSLLRYERWRDNRLIETQIEPMAQRYWGLEEFAGALSACGFTDIAVAGGFRRGRAPRATDTVLTFEARRPS